MLKAFICYSRENADVVLRLAEDLRQMGHDAWLDQEVSGGQSWWEQILARIRESDVVVFALSPRSLDSVACKREYTYAAAVGKPILPVLVAEEVSFNLLPPPVAAIQLVDYRLAERTAILGLARALNSLPKAKPLPDPLPPPPEVPVSYLGSLSERIQASTTLGRSEQSTLLVDLSRSIRDPETRNQGLTLAATFRRRPDLLASVAADLDSLTSEAAPVDLPFEAPRGGVGSVSPARGPSTDLAPSPQRVRQAASRSTLPKPSRPTAMVGVGVVLVGAAWMLWPRPASQLVVVAPPTAVAGGPIPDLTVEFRTSRGRVAAGSEGMVTVSVRSDPTSGAALWGQTTVAAERGVAVFDDVSIDTPGSGFVLMASSGDLPSIASAPINVTSGLVTGSVLAEELEGEDDEYQEVRIGFEFPFYGARYSTAWINTNGMLRFGEDGCDDYWEPDDDSPIATDTDYECDGFVAPFWSDLDVGRGNIYYDTRGTGPNREFVVEWREVEVYGEDGSSLTFNTVLYEATGDVAFQYGRLSLPSYPGLAPAIGALVGMEDERGERGLEVSRAQADVVVEGRTMRFAYRGDNFVRIR